MNIQVLEQVWLDSKHRINTATAPPFFIVSTAELTQNGKANIHLPLEKVAVPSGHKVLMEVGKNFALILGYAQGILSLEPSLHKIYLIILTNINKHLHIQVLKLVWLNPKQRIGLQHPLDSVTNPEYKCLHSIQLTNFLQREEDAIF